VESLSPVEEAMWFLFVSTSICLW